MAHRVLIVDDMATYRSIITRSLEQIENVQVVGRASNGRKALEFLEKNEVDLVTLDVEMPIMDGLATLKEISRRRLQVDVLMLSGLSDQAAQLTIQCLELGAIDFVLKPQSASFVENQNQLVESLRQIIKNLRRKPALFTRPRRTLTRPAPIKKPILKKFSSVRSKIILIGVSTGGPKALAEVFSKIQTPLPFPILIVQHMPAKFTKTLADSLDRKSNVNVQEARDGDVLQDNTAYIAPGGYHMFLLEDEDFGIVIGTNRDKPVNSCRPSVDVLFNSALPFYKPGEVACIIMTGMGRDGADGAKLLSEAGAFLATQSEETCTIYGMPKAVEDIGFQDEVLHLDDIAPFIIKTGKMSRFTRR